MSSSESDAVRDKFDSAIIGEWKFEKVNDYYVGEKIISFSEEPGSLIRIK